MQHFGHMAKIAIIDCQTAGISGDMLLSSLIDAGADKNKVIRAIIACQNFLEEARLQMQHLLKQSPTVLTPRSFVFNSEITSLNVTE